MPLVKKQSGWFWGSKGPFSTKAKALSVARAAYASGYKGESVVSVKSVDFPQGEINHKISHKKNHNVKVFP